MGYVIVGAAAFIILFAVSIIQGRNRRAEVEAFLERSFGSVPEEKYTALKLDALMAYFEKHKEDKSFFIDDITWHDLDMTKIFMLVNATNSSIGEEYLYYLLRTPETDGEVLKERQRLINYFSENADQRKALQRILYKVGKLRNISIYEYMNKFLELEEEDNRLHFLQAGGLVAAFASIFLNPSLGILAFIVMIAINFTTYFKRKAEVENYFYAVSFTIRWLDAVDEIGRLNIPELTEYLERLSRIGSDLKVIRRGASIVTSKSTGGDPIQALGDYIRMAFHADLIRFNNMHRAFKGHIGQLEELFEIIGLLDSMMSVSSFRALLGDYCEPNFAEDENIYMAEKIYHPLLDEPVKNSIQANRSCLITGSNASGKSTFIKACTINAILAQSIFTVCADSYRAPCFRIMSSMALSDDLLGGESYYVVEIRSLKRIIDAAEEENKAPVLCFIDEVLRGTNTLERIGASSTLLGKLACCRGIAFAATHDIELTYILEDYFDNYHFEEKILNDEVRFDYLIREGRSNTRNAIKLLSMLGYGRELTEEAEAAVSNYLETGEWKKLNF